VMCGGSILSCCHRNPHGHERALKEEEEEEASLILIVASYNFLWKREVWSKMGEFLYGRTLA